MQRRLDHETAGNMDSKFLLKFIGCFPDYLSALSRTLLRFFEQPLSKQLYKHIGIPVASPAANYHQSNKSYERHIEHTPTVMIRTTFFIPVTIDNTSTCAGKPAYSIATYLGTVEPKGRVHVAMWQHVHCI